MGPVPGSCRATLAKEDGSGDLLVEGRPAWSALSDRDLIWIEADVLARRPVGLPTLLAAAATAYVPAYATVPAHYSPEFEIEPGTSLTDVVEKFDTGSHPPTPAGGLSRLQRYYGRMVEVRRYETGDAREGLLLLTEEVGELAHAMRKRLEMDRTRPFRQELNVAEELADVQLFLLNLANLLEQDLDHALVAKERTNHMRAASRFASGGPSDGASFVSIEGLIGSGKTTTTEMISDSRALTPVFERVESHPFLEDFYRDGLAHVLELELAFILMRWHAVRGAPQDARIIADFSPYKDLVFSRLLLEDEAELDLVHRLHSELWQKARRPDLAIFLDAPPELAFARMRSRGRPMEQGLDVAYLERLRAEYLTSLEHLASRVVTVAVSENESKYEVAAKAAAAIDEHQFVAAS